MHKIIPEVEMQGTFARQLAQRLSRIGINPFVSEKSRYLVLLEDSPGEVIDLGRPLRGSRIFSTEAVRKNIPVVEDFVAFAKADGLDDCVFWCIGLPGAKAKSADLIDAMKAFNAAINIEFSELRKRYSFELLLLAIHPRFDPSMGLFDLHAHFVCRLKPHQREAIERRLTAKFSRIDLKTNAIRNPAAVATYMLWGIWRNKEMLSWPDHALQAAWSLTCHRFRFFRTGGSFAQWRSSKRDPMAKAAQLSDKETLQRNRRETAYRRTRVSTGDRLLTTVKVRYDGKKVAALLFEANDFHVKADNIKPREIDMYTSATIGVTQEKKESIEELNADDFTELYKLPVKLDKNPNSNSENRSLRLIVKAAVALAMISAKPAFALTSFVFRKCRQLHSVISSAAKKFGNKSCWDIGLY